MDDDGFVFDIPEIVDERKEIWNTRELIIFIIDCTNKMFETNGNNESFFKLCIECCKSTFMNKIIGYNKDLLGIIFYGTKENDPGDQNPKNIITFFKPQVPNADIVKQFEKIINFPDEFNFEAKYGHSDNYMLPDVLWHASTLINKCTSKVNIKKLILMTCEDNPHENDLMKQHQVRKKAEDLESLGIEFDIIPLGERFNGELFYDEIMQIINGYESKVEKGTDKIEELKLRTYRKNYQKRSVAKLKFTLGDDVEIGIEMFNFYRPLSIPSVTKLDKKTNEPVKSVLQMYNSETGERLLKSDLQKYVEIKNKKIIFDTDEINMMYKNGPTGIKLLGFKSLSYLRPEYHFRPSSFIYPCEELIKGSTLLFTTLLRQCLNKKKFAQCYMIARNYGKPYMVALVPQEERKTDVQITPPGFHVIYLPYAENIRELDCPTQSELDVEQVELCKKIVRKLSFKYEPKMFENPKVQTHWANIEAIALNYRKPRTISDETLQDFNEVSERLGNLELNFEETFYPDEYNFEEELTKKRKYPSYAKGNSQSKLPKIDQDDPDYIEKMVRAGTAEKLTVSALKKYLLNKNVNVSGLKKSDLLNYLYSILEI
ncbi:hypothetical protein PGB90_003031 [Kerria lacca]